MTITCSSCGFESPDGMRFCGNCGARLAAEDPAPSSIPHAPLVGPKLDERLRQAGLEARGSGAM